jgi:DNA-binding protein YbaB
MTSFSQMKDLYKLQREAKRIKKELKNIHVEAEAPGVKVVVNAEQEIVSITIAPDAPRESLAPALKDALNRAFKKAQVIAAEHMQGVMQQMGLPVGGA